MKKIIVLMVLLISVNIYAYEDYEGRVIECFSWPNHFLFINIKSKLTDTAFGVDKYYIEGEIGTYTQPRGENIPSRNFRTVMLTTKILKRTLVGIRFDASTGFLEKMRLTQVIYSLFPKNHPIGFSGYISSELKKQTRDLDPRFLSYKCELSKFSPR